MTFDEFTSAVFEEALRMGCTAAEVYFWKATVRR